MPTVPESNSMWGHARGEATSGRMPVVLVFTGSVNFKTLDARACACNGESVGFRVPGSEWT